MYVPRSQKAKYLPVKGVSVPLLTITFSSSLVSLGGSVFLSDILFLPCDGGVCGV
jgi:hypothetical protein